MTQTRTIPDRLARVLRRGLRLLAWPLLALVSAACTSTMRHPASAPTQVVLRFTYDDGQPMRHDDYMATARQQTYIKYCSKVGSTSVCDIGVDIIFMGGDAPLDANGEVRVTLHSTGPIGDNAKEHCINGKSYVFHSGDWIRGPFHNGQVVEIRYKIREMKTDCAMSTGTPPWWNERQANAAPGAGTKTATGA